MRTEDKPERDTKAQKQNSRGPLEQNTQKSREQTGSRGSRVGPKGAVPDRHGGSGTGRQQGGSGAGRER